jgi:hypothetical protein
MTINLGLTLIGRKTYEQWSMETPQDYGNDIATLCSVMRRYFLALKSCNTAAEQQSIIVDKMKAQQGYNSESNYVFIYKHNSDIVECCESAFNVKTNGYKRGQRLELIEL